MFLVYLIYKYTNSINGKIYIGQTSKSLEERAQANGNNYRECRRFYNAIKKYGWGSFVPEIIDVAEDIDSANRKEMYYISLFDSTNDKTGYNISCGGCNKELSQETKDIISTKAKTRYMDKNANPMYGKKHTEATLKKQSLKKIGKDNPMYGTRWSYTQKERCGTRGKKLNLSVEHRKKLANNCRSLGMTVGLRPVKCVEDNIEFKSITDASVAYGVSKSTLCGHLRGAQKTCKGKHFIYID